MVLVQLHKFANHPNKISMRYSSNKNQQTNMNFKLRPWTMDDLSSLVHYANNYNIAKCVRDIFPHPYTEDDGKAFIEMTKTD